jgi:glucose/arabinose dehydrogenase
LSPDGKTIYASSVASVFSWGYDPKQAKSIGAPKTLVTGMTGFDHTTRTILMPKKAPGLMLVSRGSSGNVDNKAKTLSSGISQIRVFNVTNGKTYAYTDGEILGWGLRNSIGVGEHPDGGIWSNENGADNVQYKGSDIHENNPGEEINYHGHLVGGDRSLFGKNYGYPDCGATWDTTGSASTLRTGTHFAPTGSSASDTSCAKDYVAPRLTLPSHWAPIDIKFNSNGSVAYMTSRGSWYVPHHAHLMPLL